MANAADILTNNLEVWTGAIERRSAAGRGRSKKFSLYGIEKLRALILDLAVRGKLVPQDPSEEPASALLERIAESRKDTQKLKKKDLRSTPKVRDRQIPAGWCISRLDNIANSQAGFAFKSNGFNEIGAGLPLIRIRDVGLEFSGTYYSGEYREEFVVTDGDYLISMDGDFRVAVWTNGPALLNQRVSRLQFYSNEIVKKYVVIDLQKQLSKLQGVKAYTTVDHLSGKQISEAEIALPPLAEQHRIVAKVDELMALCDRLEAQTYDAIEAHELLVGNLLATLTKSRNAEELADNWARIETHFDMLFTTEASIDQLKQTILQLAVMGKLVRQDPNDEPASELLKHVLRERTRQSKARRIRGDFIPETPSVSSAGGQLPDTWATCALGQISIITDPNPSHRYPDYKNGTVPILSTQEFDGIDGWDPSSAKLTTTDFFEFQREHCNFEDGDIVFARKGRLGLPRFLPKLDNFTFSHTVFVIKPMPGIHPEFILWFLRLDTTIDWLMNEMNKNTGVPTLGKAKTERLPLALPPFSEQKRIVAKIEDMFRMCDQLQNTLRSARTLEVNFASAVASKAVA